MKIGVMLRHFGERGGIGVYTSNLLRALVHMDQWNQYILLYRSPEHLGQFSCYANVTEQVLPAPNKLWWDQITVPRFARNASIDLIFNPKLSIPLFTKRKTVLVMHGADQFANPRAFQWYDRIYFSIANCLYCRSSTAIITMTNRGKQDIIHYMSARPDKLHVIYESYNELCRLMDRINLARVKEQYSLPDQFILFVGGVTPSKNLGNLLRAYGQIRQAFPHKLVLVGFKRWKFQKDFALVDRLSLHDRILCTGFIPDEDIPALYNLADVFVFPSLYEGFGMPVLEAMACGCPVITSKTGCSPEVAGGAALLIDPYHPDEIAESIRRVLTERALREQLIRKGLQRVQQFSWENTARATLALFESLGNAPA